MSRIRNLAIGLWLCWCVAALLVDGTPLLGPLALVAGGVWLSYARRWQLSFFFCLGTTLWWFGIEPRADRNWKAEYRRQPTATLAGDEVLVRDVRDFEFRTEQDFDERWRERRVHLSALRGVDLFVSHWGNPWIAHALVSFNFGEEGHLVASVETRQELGEGYSALRGFFRQYEITYLLAEEADVVRLRSNARQDETVRLYRTKMTPEDARRFFMAYASWMNDNARRPEWYNALTNNCTSRYTSWLVGNGIGGIPRWDWRLLANGKADEMLYRLGLLESKGLSFEELRQRSTVPRGLGREDFSLNVRRAIGMAEDLAVPIR